MGTRRGSDYVEDVRKFLVAESKRLLGAGATIAAPMFAYVTIDAMARAGIPAGRRKVRPRDFKSWVDTFMTTSTQAEYRYSGEDLYAARCGLLHELSPRRGAGTKSIGYHSDGQPHRHRPDIDPYLVILSIPELFDDLWMGVARFLKAAREDGTYAVVRKRFEEMFQSYPVGDAK